MQLMRILLLISFTFFSLWSQAQTGCPTGYENGSNLIVNSDFDKGLTGFYTEYKVTRSNEWFAGSLNVTNNPNAVHNNYKLCLDTNYKNIGQMLVVDGSENTNQIVWQQKVSVKPNTDHYFSLFFATLLKSNPAQLEISINGKRLPKPFDYHYQHCSGSVYFCFWNSETALEADIKIRAITNEVMGNDFVLDQLKLFACTKKEEIIITKDTTISNIITCIFQVSGKNNLIIKDANLSVYSLSALTKQAFTTDSNGIQKTKLKIGTYEIVIGARDYFKLKDTLTLNGHESSYSKVFVLNPLDSGVVFTLNHLVFEKSSAVITDQSKAELENVIDLMNDNPSISIDINGHTDNQGDAMKNYELSLERVTNVKDYLASRGLESKRLNGVGYGGTKPVVGYGSDEERKANRRVEFVIRKVK